MSTPFLLWSKWLLVFFAHSKLMVSVLIELLKQGLLTLGKREKTKKKKTNATFK